MFLFGFNAAALRRSPSSLARFMAEWRKVALKSFGFMSATCCGVRCNNVSEGANSSICVGRVQLLNGHAFWHESQPYRWFDVCVPAGNSPRCSIVRYDRHCRELMCPSDSIAFPGQASMHRRQLSGHLSRQGSSGSSSAVVIIEPSST